ncbi:uncharacterized protein LOC116793153 isoform X1 [Chiroxiphia lanceolata]|uniref:uncharacterized protein LOC116793153 isoform X1 n=1 Tax=Chiroxiphia lanceolata TaxID=296741 RepID=UPI0013CE6694|nr:uncharacterized protein LOC116793153 isoform X1 [Chiroxiphia lanceolata]
MVLPVIIPLGSGLTPAGIGFNPSRSPPAAPPTAAARSLENRGNQALFRPGPRCAATLRLQPRGWHGGDSGSTRAWGLTQISLSKNGRSPWVYASPLPGPAGPCGEDLAYLGLGSVVSASSFREKEDQETKPHPNHLQKEQHTRSFLFPLIQDQLQHSCPEHPKKPAEQTSLSKEKQQDLNCSWFLSKLNFNYCVPSTPLMEVAL